MRIPIALWPIVLGLSFAASDGSVSKIDLIRKPTVPTLERNITSPDRLDDRLEIAQQQVSNKCVTPSVSCVLPESAPINTPCWCATPNGPVAGFIK